MSPDVARLIVEDLDSTKGTVVDGVRIKQIGTAKHGSVVEAGDARIVFEFVDDDDSRTSTDHAAPSARRQSFGRADFLRSFFGAFCAIIISAAASDYLLPRSQFITITWIIFSAVMAVIMFRAVWLRLRDTGSSPWLSVLFFVPLIQTVLLLVCVFQRGSNDDDKGDEAGGQHGHARKARRG